MDQTVLDSESFLLYKSGFISNHREMFEEMMESLPLQTHQVVIQGEVCTQPREVCWHGPEPYTYSGLTLEPDPWTPELTEVKEKLLVELGEEFNSVLVNHYLDGSNSVGWHADDEEAFGHDPTIATVSFGSPRLFCLKPRDGGQQTKMILEPGSLMVMAGAVQRRWLHSVPKSKVPVGPRISLTYRAWNSCHPSV